MPGLKDLAFDLENGFKVTGELIPGPGWLPRADQRYEFPITDEAFMKHNRHYTEAKLKSGRVDPVEDDALGASRRAQEGPHVRPLP